MPAWAGGWDNQFGQPYALTQQGTATMRSVARLTNSVGGQAFGEIGRALCNGVGANADLSIKQVAAVQADGMNLGGVRPIATYVVVPLHATTITEKEAFQAQMTPTWAPAWYPVDKAGSGGGGMGGTINK
jgi:hypothetical protein